MYPRDYGAALLAAHRHPDDWTTATRIGHAEWGDSQVLVVTKNPSGLPSGATLVDKGNFIAVWLISQKLRGTYHIELRGGGTQLYVVVPTEHWPTVLAKLAELSDQS